MRRYLDTCGCLFWQEFHILNISFTVIPVEHNRNKSTNGTEVLLPEQMPGGTSIHPPLKVSSITPVSCHFCQHEHTWREQGPLGHCITMITRYSTLRACIGHWQLPSWIRRFSRNIDLPCEADLEPAPDLPIKHTPSTLNLLSEQTSSTWSNKTATGSAPNLKQKFIITVVVRKSYYNYCTESPKTLLYLFRSKPRLIHMYPLCLWCLLQLYVPYTPVFRIWRFHPSNFPVCSVQLHFFFLSTQYNKAKAIKRLN